MKSIGENVVAETKGSVLTITIDLAQPGHLSSTGKTMLVASTGGFQVVGPCGEALNLTVTRKANVRLSAAAAVIAGANGGGY